MKTLTMLALVPLMMTATMMTMLTTTTLMASRCIRHCLCRCAESESDGFLLLVERLDSPSYSAPSTLLPTNVRNQGLTDVSRVPTQSRV